MYCFYKQPQLNTFNNALTSSELLVFKKTARGWRKSRTVDQPSFLALIRSLNPDFRTKLSSVAVNCTQAQFTSALLSDALINLQHQIYPKILRIELTLGKGPKSPDLLVAQAENYRQHGIQISLDAVDAITDLDALTPLLAQTRELKFRMSGSETDTRQLKFWQLTARQNRLRFVAYHVTSAVDHDLLDELDVALRQGDYYSDTDKLILNHAADIA